MTIAVTNVTGGAQTGFTTPGYTVTADIAPDNNGKQWAVTAITGTQTGVTAHSVASPFIINFSRPRVFKALGKASPTTGVVSNVPFNVYKCIVRKGMLPLAGQAAQVGMARCEYLIPAGADLASPAEIRALVSAQVGVLNQQSSGWGDTLTSGII